MGGDQILFESASPQAIALVCVLYVLLLLTGTAVAAGLVVYGVRHPVDWDGRGHWLRNRPWTWREGLTVAASIGLLLAMAIGIAHLLKHPRETTLVVLQGVLLDLAGILAIAGLIRFRKWNWKAAFGMDGETVRSMKTGSLFYLAMLPFLLFASIIYQGILSARGYPSSMQDIAMLLSGDHPLWIRCFMALLAVVIAPFFEECLFRGILLPILSRWLGIGSGVFTVSLIFAAIHAHLPSLIPLMVVAACFSLAYLYSRSLWVPIVMHGLFNGINLAVLIILRH